MHICCNKRNLNSHIIIIIIIINILLPATISSHFGRLAKHRIVSLKWVCGCGWCSSRPAARLVAGNAGQELMAASVCLSMTAQTHRTPLLPLPPVADRCFCGGEQTHSETSRRLRLKINAAEITDYRHCRSLRMSRAITLTPARGRPRRNDLIVSRNVNAMKLLRIIYWTGRIKRDQRVTAYLTAKCFIVSLYGHFLILLLGTLRDNRNTTICKAL